MKNPPCKHVIVPQRIALSALAAAVFACASPANAATFTWSGNGSDANTSTVANWVSGTAPSGATANDFVFTTPALRAGAAALPVNVGFNNDLTFNTITFGAGAPAFYLSGYLANDYGKWKSNTVNANNYITQNSANSVQINAPVYVQSWGAATTLNIDGSGAGALTLDRLMYQPCNGQTARVVFNHNASANLIQLVAAGSPASGNRELEIKAGVNLLLTATGGNFTNGAGSTTTTDLTTLYINNYGADATASTIRVSNAGQTAANVLAGSTIFAGSANMTFNGNLVLQQSGNMALQFSNTGTTTFNGSTLKFGSWLSYDTRTVTLTADSGAGTTTFAGAISGTGGTGVTSVLKNGGGKVVFSGANSYDGSTTVSAGTLVISGSGTINTSSGVSITGGTLDYQNNTTALNRNVTVNGGTFKNNSTQNYTGTLALTSGTLGGTNWNGGLNNLSVGANQTISPGNSPGTASTGNQTWAGAGSYVWEINNASGTAGADPGWDLLSGTGSLTISATSGSKFNILITSLDPLTNAAGNATNFNGLTTNYQWKIADFANPISLDASAFNLNTSAFSNTVQAGSTWNIVLGNAPGISGGDNTQLWVTYSIPEPSTLALLAFSMTTVMVLRRRRMP